jgi:hypothetical protein
MQSMACDDPLPLSSFFRLPDQKVFSGIFLVEKFFERAIVLAAVARWQLQHHMQQELVIGIYQ